MIQHSRTSRTPALGLDDAFTQFLGELDARTGAVSSAMARAVLLPLAFAEGEGLPWLNLWAAVATAISDVPVRDAEIVLVRAQAAAFIVEATENNRSVYRLYHERVAEHLRRSVNESLAQRQIIRALRSQVLAVPGTEEADWPQAQTYTLTHLVSHAFKAGELSEFVADGAFLTAAEPMRVMRP